MLLCVANGKPITLISLKSHGHTIKEISLQTATIIRPSNHMQENREELNSL